MSLSRLTKITGPGIATDTNWVGNNADFTGITTTATSFNIGVTTIHSTLIEAHNIKSTGIVTATGAHFSGDVSIGGTLTYEDTTNIDSVGLITARGGIRIPNNTGKLELGSSQQFDLSINGSGEALINTTGVLNLATTSFRLRRANGSAYLMNADQGGGLYLYHNGSERLRTTATGIRVGTGVTIETNGNSNFVGVSSLGTGATGAVYLYNPDADALSGTTNDIYGWKAKTYTSGLQVNSSLYLSRSGSNGLQLSYNNATGSYITALSGFLRIGVPYGNYLNLYANDVYIKNSDENKTFAHFEKVSNHLTKTHLYSQNQIKLSTEPSGVSIVGTTTTTQLAVTGVSTFTGNIVPSSDSATDIGTNSVRFANIYADTLYGDGSNLTGITGTTINNNADNRVITGSGTANTLNGESSVIIDSSGNLIIDAAGVGNASVYARNIFISGSSNNGITIHTTDTSGSNRKCCLFFGTGTSVADMADGMLFYDHAGQYMHFSVNGAGTGVTKSSIRLSSDGTVRFDSTPTTSNSISILIKSHKARAVGDNNGILFRDANDHSQGAINVEKKSTSNASSDLVFRTSEGAVTTLLQATPERMRITSSGAINCGHGDAVNLHGSTTTGINLNGNNNSGQIIANASGNRALIIGRQGSYGQVIEFFQGTNTNEAAITIPAADTLGIETNGTERLRIDSSGRIGSHHNLSGVADYNRLMLHNPNSGSCWMQMTSTASGSTPNTDGLSIGLNSSNVAHFWLRENADMYFATNGTKRWTITSTGDLIPGGNYDIGMSSNAAYKMNEVHSNKFVHRYGNSGSATNNQQEAIWYGGGITVMHDNATLQTTNYTWGLTGHRGYPLFRIRNSNQAAIYAESGSISSGSDYRMKENIEEITNGIETVKKLKPSKYNIRKSFNPLDDGKKHHGFIAHEVQEAIPNIGNIVTGTKDAMEEVFYHDDDENIPEGKKAGDSTGTFTDNPDMQGIDYGHMTPVLAAAIKELITKVETLETKVATLEGS